jgi:CubicO group peptidase (beta-lactamase class C family)
MGSWGSGASPALAAAVLVGCAAAEPSATVAPPRQDFATPAAPPDVFADPARRAKLATAAPALDAFFAGVFERRKLPGLAVGMVVDGDLAWFKGYGVRDVATKAPVDADTVYNVASITKPFVALAVLRLRDQGMLSLDAPATTYLPELAAVVYPAPDAPPITVRHLLAHTSGLPMFGAFLREHPTPTSSQLLATLRGLRLSYAPGLRTEYSNLGLALAAQVVARVSGRPFGEFLEAEILRPLHMDASGFDAARIPRDRLAPPYDRGGDGTFTKATPLALGAFEGAGGLFASTRDMARFLAFQLDAWPPRAGEDTGPVRRSSRREMQTMTVLDSVAVRPSGARAQGIGLGWGSHYFCGAGRAFSMSGGAPEGYSSTTFGFPDEGVAFVVMTNDFQHELYDELRGGEILTILRATGGFARRVAQPNPALVPAREKLVAVLFKEWDQAEAARLFGRPFYPAASPVAWIPDGVAKLRATYGACRFERDLPPRGAAEARWRMLCERGHVEVWAQIASVAPLAIDGMDGIGWNGTSFDEEGSAVDAGSRADSDPMCP